MTANYRERIMHKILILSRPFYWTLLIAGALQIPRSIRAMEQQNAALLAAIKEGCANEVEALLESGANPNIEDDEGNTPLHVAACHYKETIKHDYKVTCKTRVKFYSTKRQQYTNIIQLLLTKSAFPNSLNKNNETPLDLADAFLNFNQPSFITEANQEITNLFKNEICQHQ